jgi:hypothetical protein
VTQRQSLSYQIDDFTGGFTDNYRGGARNKFQKIDNITITPNGKAASRDGSTNYDATYYQITDGAVRIGTLIGHDRTDTVLYHYASKIYYISAGWVNLLGPGSAQAFVNNNTTHFLAHDTWKKHTFIASSAGSTAVNALPIKIYRNESGVLKLRTAGLPNLAATANYVAATVLAQMITLANELRTDLLAHMADVTLYNDPVSGGYPEQYQHVAADSVAAALITAGACSDLATLKTLVAQLLIGYDQHLVDALQSAPAYHNFTKNKARRTYSNTARSKLDLLDAPTTYPELAAALNDLRLKVNLHFGDVNVHGDIYVLPRYITSATIDNVTTGPYVALDKAALYAYANYIKARYNVHLNSYGANGAGAYYAHSIAGGTGTVIATADATTPETWATLIHEIRKAYTDHIGIYGTTNHTGVEADRTADLLADSVSFYSLVDHDSLKKGSADYRLDIPYNDYNSGVAPGDWANGLSLLSEMKAKHNLHIDRLVPHKSAANSTSIGGISGDDPELANYVYALHYEYTYFVGTVEHVDRGPLTLVTAEAVLSIETQPLVMAAIPALANTSETHYDTSTIVVRIARTTNDGTNFFYCGQVTNGTTTFTDRMKDAQLVLQEPLYTEGGVVENDPPPMAKALHIVDEYAYYGNVTLNGVAYPNRVMQSINGDPDSVPGTFYHDFDDEVTLVNSANSRRVVVGTKYTYRMEGTIDEQGRGSLSHVKIGDVGSECPQSAVQAKEGVFFFGTDGVYLTDGYQVKNLSQDWPTTYLTLISTTTKKNRIQGRYDETGRKIYWTVQRDDANSENDALLVLDLRWPLSETACFTFWENGASFRPSSVLVFSGTLLRGDSRGYTFKHGSAYTSDPKVDTTVIPSTWAQKAIVYNLINTATDFGNSLMRKFVPSIQVFARNQGNLSMQVNSINDDKGASVAKALGPIRYRTQYTGMIREERMMPAGHLRCTYKQVQVTNALVIITNSDAHGNASVNRVAKTVTLDSAVTEDWPTDAVDFYLSFASKWDGAANVADDYVTQYLVTARTADTLTFSDAGNLAPSGSVKWVLKGIPKDEKMELQELNIQHWFITSGMTQAAYSKTETGANS